MDASDRIPVLMARQAVLTRGLEGHGIHQSRPVGVRTSRSVMLFHFANNSCKRKKIDVRATIGTSSRPKGVGKRFFTGPQWLSPSSNATDNRRRTANGEQEDESASAQSWLSSQPEYQNQTHDAVYHIVITTAKDDRSGFSEPSAGILLSLIGENGNALLQNVPGEEDMEIGRSLRFQRGATDAFTVVGPSLGRLAALWIAPAAGTWRIENVSVTIAPRVDGTSSPTDRAADRTASSSLANSDDLQNSASPTTSTEKRLTGIYHLFKSNEELLGDGASWVAAAQLKPSEIQEISNPEVLQEKLYLKSPAQNSRPFQITLRNESMKEYEELKLSLLAFSFLIAAAGTAILAVLGQGQLAEGFALGGAGGFLYLLLLQRAVDQLPSSLPAAAAAADLQTNETNDRLRLGAQQQRPTNQNGEPTRASGQTGAAEGRDSQQVTNTKLSGSPITPHSALPRTLVLVAGAALLVSRVAGGGGGAASIVNPAQLLAGVAGFLTSKAAVVLAALKQEILSRPGNDQN